MIKRYCGCIMEGSERQEFHMNSLQMTWKNKQPALFGTKLWPSGSHMPQVCFHFFPTSLLFSPSHLLPCNFTHQKSIVCACVCVYVFSHLIMPDSLWPYSLQGPVHVIFPARILEWIAIFYSRGSSQPRNQSQVACISYTAGQFFTSELPREANKPLINLLKSYLWYPRWNSGIEIKTVDKNLKKIWLNYAIL